MTPLRYAVESPRSLRTPDGALLRVFLRGPDDAPLTVVLCHGWFLSSDTWRLQVSALFSGRSGIEPGRVRVVRWEQRGHAGSTLGARRVDGGLLGAGLAAVIREFAPTGPVVLGGHCVGGVAVCALAAAHPDLVADRVRGLLLVSVPSGRPAPEGPGLPRAARVSALARRGVLGALAALPGPVEHLRALLPAHWSAHQALVRRTLFGRHADPMLVRECAELLHATPTAVIAAFRPEVVASGAPRFPTALRDVAVRIMLGEEDRLTPAHHGDALARALPDARLDLLPGVGHVPMLESPRLVEERLAELCRAAL
ncbi:alpha/beta fold hydrolase [Marinactinospora thermotolerans]|uniref:Pimeloyl-ACP methyl ester carboxylesterase n=1 Tax=Marinactinospora thermotolerans DSM 45154 TaxID=1122192 RepID=A0A1T4RTV1_9ACTN|nr:alpha/beta hydrolase [Marinactinospora thermotolerans]SKA19399.1 Pimeloyl-ACP methyl ester carboxylesterase [Marinactinospora thermotolerans DSM 45154]